MTKRNVNVNTSYHINHLIFTMLHFYIERGQTQHVCLLTFLQKTPLKVSFQRRFYFKLKIIADVYLNIALNLMRSYLAAYVKIHVLLHNN